MLESKVAVVYGAGSIGSAVTKAFAAAGARVYLASRTQAPLDARDHHHHRWHTRDDRR
jgi:3-oxoacyl-[acyl-carrier protein] reductase